MIEKVFIVIKYAEKGCTIEKVFKREEDAELYLDEHPEDFLVESHSMKEFIVE